MTQPPMTPTPGYSMQPAPQQGGGLATAAFVLGIVALCVSIVLFCVPPLGGLLGVLAIVLGAISMSQSGGAGKGRTGLILGVIAVLLSTGIYIAARAGLSFLQRKTQNLNQAIQQKSQEMQKEIEEAQKKQQEELQKQQEEIKKQQQNGTSQPSTAAPLPLRWRLAGGNLPDRIFLLESPAGA